MYEQLLQTVFEADVDTLVLVYAWCKKELAIKGPGVSGKLEWTYKVFDSMPLHWSRFK
jgi:hypothetical protein